MIDVSSNLQCSLYLGQFIFVGEVGL